MYLIGRKKRKGRPKTTWMVGIREIMIEMGLRKRNGDTEKIGDRR